MDKLEEFAKDCKIYRKAMERFARQGITDKEKVIIEMEKEIDMYREKLRGYKVSMKMDKSIKELDESLAEAAGGFIASGVLETKEVHISIIDALPDDLRDRLASVTVDSDKRISLYFLEVKNGNDKQ